MLFCYHDNDYYVLCLYKYFSYWKGNMLIGMIHIISNTEIQNESTGTKIRQHAYSIKAV